MNKIQSPIIVKKKDQANYIANIHSSAQSTKKTKHQLSPINLGKLQYKQSPAMTHFSFYRDEDAINIQYNSKDIRFSRFANWDLTQIFYNQQVPRTTQVKQHKAYAYLLQSQQSFQAEYNNYLEMQPSELKMPNFPQKQIGLYPNLIANTNSTKIQKLDCLIKPKLTGLRKLSSRAYKIVKQYGQVTYKQVASKLIRQIFDDQAVFDDEKQENNIKRRVYDALNVLIAMGILNKVGKNITYGLNRNQQSINILHKQKKQSINKQIESKKKQIARKKQQKRKIANKIKALHQLIIRNKQKPIIQHNVIRIPFVCISSKPSLKIQMAQNQDICTIQLKDQHAVVDALDCLPKIFLEKNR